MVKIKTLTTATFVVIGVAFIGWRINSIPEPGWCPQRNERISDAAFVRTVNVALAKYFKSSVTLVHPDGRKEEVNIKEQLYPHWNFSPDNILCCQVEKEKRSVLAEAFFGAGGVTVEVSPVLIEPFPWGSDSNYRFFFDACGVLIDSDVGLPDTSQRYIQVD